MTDYSDLVKRLRGKKLNCNCAAKSASECCCNTDWPESSCTEAADAIEVLERDIVLVTDAMVALTDRVHEIKEALKRVLDDIADYERINNLYPNPGKEYCWESVVNARKVLGEKND